MKSRFSVSSTAFALVVIAASLAMALELGNAKPVHAATPDDYTADTTTTGAVAVGGFASGEIEELQDVDWFAVTLEAGKTYYFTAWGTEKPYYLGTLYMPRIVGLYDSRGTEIAGTRKVFDLRSGRTNPQRYLASADGVHYVAVTGVGSSGWALGTYTLVVAESPADDCVEGVTTTCLVSVGGSFTGNIQWTYDNNPWPYDNNPFKHPQDVDWIRANLTAGKTYRFTLEGADAGKGTLKRPSLNQVLYYVNDEGKVAALSFQERVKAPHSGVYYIQVEGDGEKEEGTYTLTLTEVSNITDDFPDDSTTTGTVTVSNSVDQGLSCLGTTGNIEVSRDVDWFSVQLEAGKNYLVSLSGARSSFHCRYGTRDSLQLKGIYDSTGVPVAKAADYNPLHSLITFRASSSGTYYVAAGARAGSGEGAYRVAVGRLPDDDYSADTDTDGSLAVGGTASGTLQTFSDVDWLAASLTAGQSYLFEIEPPTKYHYL